MSNVAWMRKGKEGQQWFDNLKHERSNSPFRFWLRPDTSAELVFLDGEGMYIREHNMKIHGKFGNFFTCIRDFAPCPLCQMPDKTPGRYSSPVVAFTVIDLTGYVDKEGKQIRNVKRLLVLRKEVAEKLIKKAQSRKVDDLTGWAVRFTRYNEQEANTGEDIEFLQKVDLNKLAAVVTPPEGVSKVEFMQPYNYEKIFEPKPEDQLMALARSVSAGGGSASYPQTPAPTQAVSSAKSALDALGLGVSAPQTASALSQMDDVPFDNGAAVKETSPSKSDGDIIMEEDVEKLLGVPASS